MKKKLLALLLAALMIVSILPVSAFAEEEVGTPAPVEGNIEVDPLDPAVAAANALMASSVLNSAEAEAPGASYADKAEENADDAEEDAAAAAAAAAQAAADAERAVAAAAQAKADYHKAATLAAKQPTTLSSLFSGLRSTYYGRSLR